MGTVLGLKAFAIAIIAGLAAPRGILICGLLYGAFEGLVSGYLYTGIRDIVGFSIMIVAHLCASGRDIWHGDKRNARDKKREIARCPELRSRFTAMPVITGGTYYAFLGIIVFIYSIVSIGLNILSGYAGQFSLGHAAFMAMGAYTTAILTKSSMTV